MSEVVDRNDDLLNTPSFHSPQQQFQHRHIAQWHQWLREQHGIGMQPRAFAPRDNDGLAHQHGRLLACQIVLTVRGLMERPNRFVHRQPHFFATAPFGSMLHNDSKFAENSTPRVPSSRLWA
jgi:hypothetical protein